MHGSLRTWGHARAGLAAALIALVLAAPAAATPPATAATPAAARPNVIVILVDTLRADRMGWHGRGGGLTPFLDGLAAQGAVFPRAYAPSAWTTPSVASLFTSRYPSQHGQNHFGSALPRNSDTLASALANGGYTTMSISGHGGMSPTLGLTRGFQLSRLVSGPAGPLPKAPASQVTADALAALDRRTPVQRARPLFLYLHFMEPHMPYTAPDEMLDHVLRPLTDRAAARAAALQARAQVDDLMSTMLGRTRAANAAAAEGAAALDQATMRRGLEILYDAEVVHIDRRLGQLFGGLRQRGLLDDTLVVVTADHGEEFYEHGGLGHGTALYEETVHVPLLFWRSTRPQPVRSDAVVSLVDVAPTVLDEVGLPIPPSFVGRSLAPALAGRPWPDAAAPETTFSELYPVRAGADRQTPARAVIHGARKLIVQPDGVELSFDLRTDPGELAPLADDAEHAALRSQLDEFVARVAPDSLPTEVLPLDDATRERLRALGYAY